MTSWASYLDRFQKEYAVLKTELLKDCSEEIGPFLRPTATPGEAPWLLDWAVIFSDGNYMRVKESFRRCGQPHSGLGQRLHFSYHYGLASQDRDASGFPDINNSHNILRIDEDRYGPHLHTKSEDHIPQERVMQYNIHEADPFQFVKMLIEHRKSGENLLELLNITVQSTSRSQ